MDEDERADLVGVLADGLQEALVPLRPPTVRPGRKPPVRFACRWCGKASNPRGDVDAAVRDLAGHLHDHEEYIEVLVTRWRDLHVSRLTKQMQAADVAGRRDEVQELWAEVRRIKAHARSDLGRALERYADAQEPSTAATG